ncbi:hypothetical protein RYD26_05280 [Pasteurellaceae bacterium LIM206]|nr:hypothetical protein [Pasteurellaceae bacterium LIM206]
MTHKKILTSLTLIINAALATATTQAATKPIFACTATDGNPIIIEKSDMNYILSYKKLKISNAVKDIMQRNNSIIASRSGYVLYSLEFEDKQDSYYVQYRESMGDAKPMFAGIFKVAPNATPKEFAVCDLKKTIKSNFEISLMQQSGNGY